MISAWPRKLSRVSILSAVTYLSIVGYQHLAPAFGIHLPQLFLARDEGSSVPCVGQQCDDYGTPDWTFGSLQKKCLRSNNTFPLLDARRNHDAIFSTDGNTIYNIAGRGVTNVEAMHLPTCRQFVAAESELLDLNHISAARHNGQIVLSTGLVGAGVNEEWSSDHMIHVQPELGVVQRGPAMRIARGAGTSTVLKDFLVRRDKLTGATEEGGPNEWREDLLCIFGGSMGSHDKGTFTPYVDCYSEKTQGWLELPDLPLALDHLVIIQTPTELVAVGGRQTNYAGDVDTLYSLALNTQQGTVGEKWEPVGNLNHVRSAFGAVPVSGRYILALGGVHYYYTPAKHLIILDSIEVCDLEAPRPMKCAMLKTKMIWERFAMLATVRQWGGDEGGVFICGGTHTGPDNVDFCEVISIRALLDDIHETLGQ